MLIHSLLTSMAVVLAPPGTEAPSVTTSEPTVERCEVASIQDLPIPGSDAGVLIEMKVREGMAVKKGTELAKIYDREAAAMYTVKQLEYEIAKQKAVSDIDVRYADATAKVAKALWDKTRAANQGTIQNVVSKIEELRTEYEYKKALLGVEKNKEDGESNKLTARSKQAEADAAKVALDRRTIVAPFDGIVVKIYTQEGAWVAPGDPVLQVVRVDRLRVHGNVDASKWNRGDVDGRKVTVEVQLPRGRQVKVPGTVVFVSPVVGVGSQLPVTAEIDTPMEGGKPLISAGMYARMTIHTDQTAANPAPPAAAPAAATIRPASKR